MTKDNPLKNKNTSAFFAQAAIAFGISAVGLLVGVAYLPLDIWQRLFLGMTALFTITSSFTLAKVIRDSANLREEQVSVSVGRRRATAHVHPTTGVPVDREAVQSDAQKVADSYALTPPLRVSVDIDKKGMVG